MGRKKASVDELAARSQTKGYTPGAHQTKDSTKVKRGGVEKTLEDQSSAIEQYEQWVTLIEQKQRAGQYHGVVPKRLEKGVPSLDLATLKDFVRYKVSVSQGLIDDKGRPTADSMNTFEEWFFAGFARITGNSYAEEDRQELYKWTRDTLVEETLVVKIKKPKHNFGEHEWIQFHKTFWTNDDIQFTHPRNKVQIPFAIAIFCWTGARIGAFFPNKHNKHEAGLRYRDIEVVLTRILEGGWKVIYRVDQRWVKNNRNPENTTYGASTFQHDQLNHDDTQYLLALALADKAFYGIDSLEDLWQLQIPPDDSELILRWKDSAKYLPILRNATKDEGVSTEPLSRSTFQNIVKSVLKSSGFFGAATVHSIRRYLGKKINERYTEVERSQHITQTDLRTYGRDYVANLSSVDGKSAFFNEPAQHDHINYFQSFRKFQEKGLPTSLPAEKKVEVRQNPCLLELEDTVRGLQRAKADEDEIRAAQNKARSYRCSLTNKTLKTYQFEWVQKRRDWKIVTRGKQRPDDNEEMVQLGILSRIMPERGRLARAMVSKQEVSLEERRQVIEDLCTLASRDCTTIYLPEESPIHGVCPTQGCHVEMQSLPKYRRSTHIHQCRRRELACALGRRKAELEYCYACFSWFVEEEWDEHCQMHLKSIQYKRCGRLTYCGTLIHPAYCPFCLNDKRLVASLRWRHWIREEQLRDHLQFHLRAICWPLQCPHPLCHLQLDDETSFLYHMVDVHGLTIKSCLNKRHQNESSEPFVQQLPNVLGTKRKGSIESTDEERATKQSKSDMRHTLRQTSTSESTESGATASTSQRPDIPVIDLVAVEDTYSPLTSSASGLTLLSDGDGFQPIDDILHIQQHMLPDRLEPEDSLPVVDDDDSQTSLLDDDALFSLFLRSRSPSSSGSENIDQSNHTISRALESISSDIPSIHASAVTSTDLLDTTENGTIESGPIPVTRKPRVTLRLRPPKEITKPKTKLRLTQPRVNKAKKPTCQKSTVKKQRRRKT